jgi:glyoxylase I family protein
VAAGRTERPTTTGLDHFGLSVTDLAKSTSFYCDVLGAKVVYGEHDEDSFRRIVVQLGSWIIDLNQFHENDGTPFDVTRTGLDHLGLTASSREALDDWGRWLDANGVPRSEIRDTPAPIVGAMFDFVDPDAIQFEFSYIAGFARSE